MHGQTTFKECRSNESIFKELLCNWLGISKEDVLAVDLSRRIIIRCNSADIARNLEKKLNEEDVATTQGFTGIALEVPSTSRDKLMNLMINKALITDKSKQP